MSIRMCWYDQDETNMKTEDSFLTRWSAVTDFRKPYEDFSSLKCRKFDKD